MRLIHPKLRPIMLGCSLLMVLGACDNSLQSDVRNQSVGYRTGTEVDDYTSNAERGNVRITEIN